MIKRPVMWAIGFKYKEDAFYNFMKGEEDTNLTFNHLVPSKDMAEELRITWQFHMFQFL